MTQFVKKVKLILKKKSLLEFFLLRKLTLNSFDILEKGIN